MKIHSTKIVRLVGGEYVVRAYGRTENGIPFKIPAADYFTDDLTDARQTADAMVAPKIVNAVPSAGAPGFVVVVEKEIAPLTYGRNDVSCGSGWTGDRCTKRLGHRGAHSNEGGR